MNSVFTVGRRFVAVALVVMFASCAQTRNRLSTPKAPPSGYVNAGSALPQSGRAHTEHSGQNQRLASAGPLRLVSPAAPTALEGVLRGIADLERIWCSRQGCVGSSMT